MLFKGRRTKATRQVLVDGKDLSPRHDLFNHSPSGFEWGYLGSGPAQLALAILAHRTQNPTVALTYHQQFKQEVISHLPVPGWTLDGAEVDAWLRKAGASF